MFDRRASDALAILTKDTVTANDQEKARAALDKAVERLRDKEIRDLLLVVFKWLATYSDESRRLPGSDYLQAVRQLTNATFARSAEVLFMTYANVFQGVDFLEVAAAAPTVKSVEFWIKASGGIKARKILEEYIHSSAHKAYESPLCDWALQKTPPEKCGIFLEKLLLRQPRPAFLPAWDQILAELLDSDERGVLLSTLLSLALGNPQMLESLALLLNAKLEVFARVVDRLPYLFRRIDKPGGVEHLIRALFEGIHVADEVKRRQLCAVLARLGAGLLLEYRDVEQASEALKAVQTLAMTLKTSAVSEESKANTWVFEHLGAQSETPTGGTHVNHLGASHVAIAFSKASEGYSAKDILLMLAHNLGMIQVGEPGELVNYDPLRHEDIVGGLLPGVTVKVAEPGWALNQEVVVRAKVSVA